MAAKGLLSILSQYKSYTVLIGFRHKLFGYKPDRNEHPDLIGIK